MLAKASAYVKIYDEETKSMFFYWSWWIIVKNSGIWRKVYDNIKKELDCKTNLRYIISENQKKVLQKYLK